jgi:hypothetical protein
MHIDKEMPDKAVADVDKKTMLGQTAIQGSIKSTTVAVDGTRIPGALVPPGECLNTSKGMLLAVSPEISTEAVDISPTKMKIATAIFKRMRKSKGTTRKEIIDQFVEEAKLSKAGAATYYQLIKAKVR